MTPGEWLNASRRTAACLLLGLSMTDFAAASTQSQADKVAAILSAAGLNSGAAPGAAVLVVRNGGVDFERGIGVADLHSQRAIDGHTNFRLASVSKQFTAMAIMLLVHDGKLKYDDRLSDILPGFPEYGKAIRIRNLLNHTSGLKDYEDLMPPAEFDASHQIQDAAVQDLLMKQQTTEFMPGSKWAYSNSGYVLLGLIAQKVSGEPFPDFLNRRIFAPLHMGGTLAYVRGKNQVSNRAFGYSMEGGLWTETDQGPTSATLGDGGVYSSLADLAKWDRALRQHTLLSANEMEAAFTPVELSGGEVRGPDGEPAAYGFGWFLNSYKGHRRMWHYGETIGFRTAIQRFVEHELTIIVLLNRTDLNAADLALRIADLYLP